MEPYAVCTRHAKITLTAWLHIDQTNLTLQLSMHERHSRYILSPSIYQYDIQAWYVLCIVSPSGQSAGDSVVYLLYILLSPTIRIILLLLFQTRHQEAQCIYKLFK